MTENRNKEFIVIIALNLLPLFCFGCSTPIDYIGIIEKCIWPIVILILGVIFLLIQKKPIGRFIDKIITVVFERTENGRIRFMTTGPQGIQDTLSSEPREKTKTDLSLKIEKLLKEKNFPKIIKECKKLQEEEKETILSYIFLGRSFMKQGKFPEAYAEFEKALAIKDDDSEVYYYLGILQQRKGDLKGSLKYMEKAYTLTSNDPRITLNLGYIHNYFYGNANKAIEFTEKSHDDYKKGFFPLEDELDIRIHNSLAFYLACRSKKVDIKRSFEIDKYLDEKYKKVENIIKSRILDTRGYLRYKAIEKGYITKDKNNILFQSINFLTDACKINLSNLEALQHLIEVLNLQRKMREKTKHHID